MGITVRIPSPLRQYTELKSEIVLEGKTVAEAPDSFRVRLQEAGDKFFAPKTAHYMNLYLNDKDIRTLSNRDIPVADNDIPSIVFAVAGG
jgi:molybdopterin converting factor small subunit